jgi:magnesium transporter
VITVYTHQHGVTKRVEGVEREWLDPGSTVTFWVDLAAPTADEARLLSDVFAFHPLAVEDATKQHQRAKIDRYDSFYFIVVHDVDYVAEDNRIDEHELDIFLGRNYLVTVHYEPIDEIGEVAGRLGHNLALIEHGVGVLLYSLLDTIVDHYFPVVDALETELEAIEDRIFAGGSPRENVEALYGLKQKLGVFRHAVAPLLEAVNNLYGARAPRICAEMKDYFRDISDHLQRLNQTIESIRDTIATAIAVNLSMISLQENETMKRLAYGALVAVPTMIAGIYGMNFAHMPELDWKFGYVTVVGIMVAIDAYLFHRLRKAKWL